MYKLIDYIVAHEIKIKHTFQHIGYLKTFLWRTFYNN
ncbi:hypothetical protein CoNPh10_CDS0004 [Staphylococcus phage S-CoN_Ph10]|nr:hypothetical protein CoNPh1_CDS0002 [Staphylococcus phage S-CoN_Ph1]WNM51714.1 hypothetical protein CoNPh2_CDS0160 [Staphylococcus phage S-CoN_Ph2]WNM51874.1 hypothetical protein CoNPh3_CDS0160 [Staphylococcus phage S-CoN_Ph3]WNM51878.1 hypothetical protein CoNPh4_CDS0002 [Staphylococcus phage S-CoN_Ph4]WNM52061.1 hypothetical protein CoNPh5_CDS0015 [Staphylococcus phage S-CoN_Ph5]WNM52372.1 hypothetical protein CoNPh6_CDS0162 [Staphylococcus phage S-CoN_Ph6]WNM52554.1 hypothetical protein